MRLPSSAGNTAAKHSSLDMMKFVYENGGQYTPDSYSAVYERARNPFEKIKYLHEVARVPFPSTVCKGPAESGHLHIIQYLVDHGAILDHTSIYLAASKQRRNILEYAQSLGYDVRELVVRMSWDPNLHLHHSTEVRRWIKNWRPSKTSG